MGFPALGSRTNELNHAFILTLRHNGLGQIVPICLVNHNGIRHLHNALLNALQIVTCTGEHNQHKKVHHGTHGNFALPYANSFY